MSSARALALVDSGLAAFPCLAFSCLDLSFPSLDLSFCSSTAVPLVCAACHRNVLPETNKSVGEGVRVCAQVESYRVTKGTGSGLGSKVEQKCTCIARSRDVI